MKNLHISKKSSTFADQNELGMAKGSGIYSLLSKDKFQQGYAWIVLIVGVVLYVFVFWLIPNYFEGTSPTVTKILETIAQVLVVGGVAGTLVNTAQNMGVFQEELKDILYGKDFLRKREDVPEIWEEMTKVMYQSRFENIPPSLIKTIRKLYLPENPTYVQNRISSVHVEWVDKSRKIVSVIANDAFEYIPGTSQEAVYKSSMAIDIHGLSKEDYSYEVSYKVDGEEYDSKRIEEQVGEEICWRNIIKLRGKDSYFIVRTTKQKFSLENDHVYAMNATISINGFMLDFTYPKDLHAIFSNMGTTDDFEIVEHQDGHIVARSKGLILNKQGYLIAFFNK